jgi:NDP-sugar pyrophosphorylase family protein
MSKDKNIEIEYGLILAAGRGTRLGEITEEIPKALVEIKDGKKVIDYILEGYAAAGLKKAVIIIAYKGQKIKEYLGARAHGLELIYFEQNLDSYGTAAAVKAARSLLEDQYFLMSYGDIITQPKNYLKMIEALAKLKVPRSIMLLNWLDQIKKGGLVEFKKAPAEDLKTAAADFYQVQTITEKPELEGGGWNSAGIYLFSPDIFNWIDQVKPSKRGEYELPAAVNLMLKGKSKLFAVKSEDYCQDVGTPEDLEYLRSQIQG